MTQQGQRRRSVTACDILAPCRAWSLPACRIPARPATARSCRQGGVVTGHRTGIGATTAALLEGLGVQVHGFDRTRVDLADLGSIAGHVGAVAAPRRTGSICSSTMPA